ncbi:hypothetical protein B9Z55_025163 [Caenorhabditis nigoni]|uniref:Uncharacterized protein n=1 Tax=Caenorhabditis nigoni TaxID=1611254 RepID=A0A2G5SXZ7_9PELO|nr:hypothetical protein B9Z55_025163 [Caenorhabditis nigoni]
MNSFKLPPDPYREESFWRDIFEKYLAKISEGSFSLTDARQYWNADHSFLQHIAFEICGNFILTNWGPQAEKFEKPEEKCPKEIIADIQKLELKSQYDKLVRQVIFWKITVMEMQIRTYMYEEQRIDDKWTERSNELRGLFEYLNKLIEYAKSTSYNATPKDLERMNENLKEIEKHTVAINMIQGPVNTYHKPGVKANLDILERALDSLKLREVLLEASVELNQKGREEPAQFKPHDISAQVEDIMKKIEATRSKWKTIYTDKESKKYSETADYFLEHARFQFYFMGKSETEFILKWTARPDVNLYHKRNLIMEAMQKTEKITETLIDTKDTLLGIYSNRT